MLGNLNGWFLFARGDPSRGKRPSALLLIDRWSLGATPVGRRYYGGMAVRKERYVDNSGPVVEKGWYNKAKRTRETLHIRLKIV